MARAWTEEEIRILKENISLPRREIAKLVGRSAYAVEHKIRKLGLAKERGKPWTSEEIQILRENYHKMSLKELKEKFFPHRSIESILTKASRRLGLRKPVTFWCSGRGKSSIRELSEAERYYLAGIIDGEGTITIKRSDNRLYCEVSVGNSCLELIKRIQKMISTNKRYMEKRRKDPNRKPLWVFKISARPDVKKLLEQIKDALIVKKKQAELVLEFIDIMDSRLNIHSIPPKAIEIYEKVRELNRRGATSS